MKEKREKSEKNGKSKFRVIKKITPVISSYRRVILKLLRITFYKKRQLTRNFDSKNSELTVNSGAKKLSQITFDKRGS